MSDTGLTRDYLHASHWAGALGLSQWADRTPLDIYALYRGLLPEPEDSDLFRLGRFCEPVVLEMARRYVDWKPSPGEVRSVVRPWLGGTPDAIPLEAKTARSNLDWGEPPDGPIPIDYEIQCRAYMYLCNLPFWHLGVWFRLQDDVTIYTLNRDTEWEIEKLEGLRRFWFDCVLAGNAPPATERTSSAAKAATCPQTTDLLIQANGEQETLVWKYRDLMSFAARAEANAFALRSHIEQTIGTAAGIQGPWGRITYKADKRGRRTWRVTWAGESNGQGAGQSEV
jgi:hypothetical protein